MLLACCARCLSVLPACCPSHIFCSGNGELEYYVDELVGYNPFSVSNSVLSIQSNRGHNLPINNKGVQLLYTYGLITTEPSFNQTYGYFEIRTKLPWGKVQCDSVPKPSLYCCSFV
jgi:beta-glucanase (GH16 family)